MLLVRGVRPALFGSAALFGLMHVVNLANGSDPITVAAQVLMTSGVGIGFGAVALVPAPSGRWSSCTSSWISPTRSRPPRRGGHRRRDGDLLVNGGINVALGALAAGYGLWLVRRRVGLIEQLDGG